MTITLNVANPFFTFLALTVWSAIACWMAFKAGERSTDPATALPVTAARTWKLYVASMLLFYVFIAGLYRLAGV